MLFQINGALIINNSNNEFIDWWKNHTDESGRARVYQTALMVQSLAILEILHAALGLVRSGVFTTTLQVMSRIAVIGIFGYPYRSIVSEPASCYMIKGKL